MNFTYFRLNDVREYVGKEIPCVIVGTKSHVATHKREVTTDQAMIFSDKHKMPLFELLSLDKEHLDNIFYNLIDMMINDVMHKDFYEHKHNVNLNETNRNETSKCSC